MRVPANRGHPELGRAAREVLRVRPAMDRGIPSAAQRKIAAELVAAGCSWFSVRSSRAALAALFYAGIPFSVDLSRRDSSGGRDRFPIRHNACHRIRR
jgi:hypothetical protein